MADFPAMPLWTDAYLADTRHLTDAEHGRYLLMLFDMWRMAEKRFPNDDAWMARKFTRPIEDIQKLFRPLIREFFRTDGNWITHKRVDREWGRLRENSDKNRANANLRWRAVDGGGGGGTVSSKPLSKKEKERCDRYAGSHMQPQPQPQPQPYPKKVGSEPYPDSESMNPDSQPGTNIVRLTGGRGSKPPPLFDQLWNLQRLTHQKRRKDAAAKAWAKAARHTDPEHIVSTFAQHQRCWERHGYDVQFIPHLANWLDDKRWQDDLPAPRENGNGKANDWYGARLAREFQRETDEDLCGPGGPVIEGRAEER